jgi:hypothetical protein
MVAMWNGLRWTETNLNPDEYLGSYQQFKSALGALVPIAAAPC